MTRGDAKTAMAGAAKRFGNVLFTVPGTCTGPLCAVADFKPDGLTVWTASQSTHLFRVIFSESFGLPQDKVRFVYLEGSGCYGQNGNEDACADAAILPREVGKPVRLQWMRHDEHGWDPKGPPQLVDLRAGLDAKGNPVAWETETWWPVPIAARSTIPLIGFDTAGITQPRPLAGKR